MSHQLIKHHRVSVILFGEDVWLVVSVTAEMATLISRDSKLLGAQVELHRDEQESEEATPRGVRLTVITPEGP